MFKRPEELIVFVLGLLWVVLTYFLTSYLGADTYTSLVITGFTLLWAVVCFMLWQRDLSRMIWPWFLGLLVACWWPLFDWFAVKDFIETGAESQAIVVAKPWYASWTFKIILALIPVALGYFIKFKRARQAKINTSSSF